MNRRKHRWITMLLSAMIAFSAVTPSTAYAAENVLSDALIQDDAAKNGQTLQAAGQTLSGLSITDLDKPVLGVAFDTTAMVRTAEGVSWEIPVIWADENGREAAVPEAGTACRSGIMMLIIMQEKNRKWMNTKLLK